MLASVGGLCIFFGSIGLPGFLTLLLTTDYTPPPVPFGYVIGMFLFIFGISLTVTNIIMAVNKRKNPTKLAEKITITILSATLLAYGIMESFVNNPFELTDCPCDVNYYGSDCTFCPNTNLGVCNGRGECDDGVEGSGACFCDYNWAGDSCQRCAATFQGANCDECKRGWTGEKCDTCYPGYSGSNCDVCAEGWVTENDVFGLLCRRCLPGYFGAFCEKCRNCTLNDPLATCRDNEWHEENDYNPNICTSQGQTCDDKYGCDSFNCKGICAIGDTTTGKLCESDGECFPGTCEFKQCCLEPRHGDGHCECASIGYEGEDCRACPGFDNVYSQTICSGHGNCIPEYAGDTYVGLQCACDRLESEPFPAWTGETCSCLKDSPESECIECASGSYGPTCNSCPGGTGLGQCSRHGKCDDGLNGEGTCDCDLDLNYGGIGAFKGEACQSCLSDDFYSDECQPCPNLQLIQCIPGLGLTQIPGVGLCISSCGAKTCNAQGICVV